MVVHDTEENIDHTMNSLTINKCASHQIIPLVYEDYYLAATNPNKVMYEYHSTNPLAQDYTQSLQRH